MRESKEGGREGRKEGKEEESKKKTTTKKKEGRKWKTQIRIKHLASFLDVCRIDK